jgi:hypothetical protein
MLEKHGEQNRDKRSNREGLSQGKWLGEKESLGTWHQDINKTALHIQCIRNSDFRESSYLPRAGGPA